jgi:glycosyltransferase involved in cell wall biosynthesis
MIIAFDGTVLHGRKSGVGYYCEELLKAMLAVDHESQFVVFSHLRLKTEFLAPNGNLKFTDSFHFPIRAFYLHALLPRLLESIRPDICHYTNFLAPITQDRPYVVTIHDMGMEALRQAHPLAKRLYTRRLVPHVARKARLLITNSEYSKWEIVRYLGIPEDRIRVTPLAASAEFAPTPHRPDTPYFLYVGNLEPRKNIERLIEAFAQMPRKDHQLVIVGERWFHGEASEEKARSLGLNGRVKFLGYVPRENLPALFSGATGFVYPSLLEGFGLPVVEAMACGAPVITSDNSSMKEVARDAAILVNPRDVREITDALVSLAEDERLRRSLSRKGLARAAEFSWERTARVTLEAYRDAAAPSPRPRRTIVAAKGQDLLAAIQKTVDYALLFQYPLLADEVRERLFDVQVDEREFAAALKTLGYRPDRNLMKIRAERERISDHATREIRTHLRTLASMPFVRMIAFSGSTAHRNMTDAEDIDLFMVVEDGKLWAFFLGAIVWAKAKGLRKRLCMNYLITDRALPLFEHDPFTAQQAASLKPVYGKDVYDRFIEANPFIRRCFPNFDPLRHRNVYAEVEPGRMKLLLEALLRKGPVQIVERLSRRILGRYLAKKIRPESDVQLDPRRLKLHLQSHKQAVLSEAERTPAGSFRT